MYSLSCIDYGLFYVWYMTYAMWGLMLIRLINTMGVS